ncbi:MAG: hypothetical protein JW775_03305 [Candidatus Aminicenantes bacterium]|nr:hypothetical protein [Candidatus Aminicenantes bacterium]
MNDEIEKDPKRRAEAAAIERLLRETEAVRAEIRSAADSVDWEALPAVIADRARAGRRSAQDAFASARPWDRLFAPRLRPVLAGLLGGLVIGATAMYFALRAPEAGLPNDLAYHASDEFLDRAELEMARRSALDYLEKGQYMLLDIFESVEDGSVVPAAVRADRARDLLQQKKYLNTQLDRYQMAKAKAICDQIEMLFRELAGISEELSAAELRRIRDLIEERQLLLKINLVREELQSGV